MRILLTGATGFIGTRLRRDLRAAGHELVCTFRRRAGPGDGRCVWVKADFAAATPPNWVALLRGVDAVVNAAGLFCKTRGARFAAVNTLGPIALFDACAAAGVRRVLQISALGASPFASNSLLLGKDLADTHLLTLPLQATVLQPSLVHGPEGAATRQLLRLATLPWIVLPLGGPQCVQPVHVDDLVEVVRVLLETTPALAVKQRVAVVGPAPMTLRRYVLELRAGLGLGPARVLALPESLTRAIARVGDRLAGSVFCSDTWRLLQAGSCADPTPFSLLLRRRPRPAQAFIALPEAAALRRATLAGLASPMLAAALAALWLWSAATALVPLTPGATWRSASGLHPALQPAAVYGAASLDLLMGALTLSRRARSRALWTVQGAVVAAWTGLGSWLGLHHVAAPAKMLTMTLLIVLLWTLQPAADAARPR